jgi:hypothetical protein
MIMSRKAGKPSERAGVLDAKTAIRKLNETYRRMRELSSRKLRSYGATLFLEQNVREEDIERRVKNFGDALANFLRIKKKANASMAALEKGLKDLEGAEDVGEISTLIGLTVLSDRRDYNRNAARLRDYYDEEIGPTMPDVTKIVRYASESIDFGRWLDRLLNRDLKKGQDDLTDMIEAISNLDLNKFNEISERLNKRIEAEEKLIPK